jgi:RHS repeat-associated protein
MPSMSKTWYNWDSGYTVISEETGSSGAGTLTRTYVGRSLAHVDGSNPATGTWRYMYHDHLGSVRQVRDANRNLVAEYAFLPYGQTDAWSGTANATTRLFTGHDRDPLTNQDYAPYRWYSNTMSRWLSRDPLGMIDGPNVYAYVRGNPVLRYDSRGLFSTEGCCGTEKENIEKQVQAACEGIDDVTAVRLFFG